MAKLVNYGEFFIPCCYAVLPDIKVLKEQNLADSKMQMQLFLAIFKDCDVISSGASKDLRDLS